MKPTILIIHGIGGHAGIHWQKWLKDELKKQGYQVVMPTMPNADHPDRKEWLKTIEVLTQNINNSNLIIVGHSLGVTSALDFIEIQKTPIKALFSVSGFDKDYHSELNSYFLKEKEIDAKKIIANCIKRIVIYSNNDPYVPQKFLSGFAEDIKADEVVVIEDGGHIGAQSGLTKLPVLFDLITEIQG